MTRAEFREYLVHYGKRLEMRFQDVGPLAGLPIKFSDALEVAKAMRVLDHAAPSTDELREWYRAAGFSVPPGPTSPAMRLYEALDGLRETDLAELDESQLILLRVRLDNWISIAHSVAARRRLMRA
jgi:hypothetical protein